MSRHSAIPTTAAPATVDSLREDLLALGVQPGTTLIVHSSLSKLGWVCGHAQAVILALESALGPEGTLVMPTHTPINTDPANWVNPPVDESWWEPIRRYMPAFDRDLTPCPHMGALPETFRKQRGVLRSDHPQVSFAAWGRHAEVVTANHALHYGLGDGSPLARVYDLDGCVLLIGVDHGNNTSLHLAEHRADSTPKTFLKNGAAMMVEGLREWVKIDDIEVDSEDFAGIGAAFASETGKQNVGRIAAAESLLMPQRDLVDFGVGWMQLNRTRDRISTTDNLTIP